MVSHNPIVFPYAIKNITLNGILILYYGLTHAWINYSVTVGHLGGFQSLGEVAESEGWVTHQLQRVSGCSGSGSSESRAWRLWGTGCTALCESRAQAMLSFMGEEARVQKAYETFLRSSLEDHSTSRLLSPVSWSCLKVGGNPRARSEGQGEGQGDVWRAKEGGMYYWAGCLWAAKAQTFWRLCRTV